jgi:hypothetical protein
MNTRMVSNNNGALYEQTNFFTQRSGNNGQRDGTDRLCESNL